MSDLTLSGITNTEAELTLELTIGTHIYTTAVTFFGANPGLYSTSIPR
jgi:hypothetical protein